MMKTGKLAIVLFVLLTTGLYCTQSDAAVLTGRITAQNTGYGIEAAAVTIHDGTSETKVTTDPFGFYQIRDVAAGTYNITVSRQGYHSAMENTVVIGTEDRTKKSYILELLEPGAILFDVFAQVGCVVSNLQLENVPVKVTVTNNEGAVTATRTELTNASGFAEFRGMKKGFYEFSINEGGIPGWESYKNMEIPTLETDHMANVLLKPEYRTLTVTVKGYNPVTQQDNALLEGITVEAAAADPGGPEREILPAEVGVTGMFKDDPGWNNAMVGKVEFEKLIPVYYAVRGKRLGYLMEEYLVKTKDAQFVDVNGQVTNEITLNMTLLNTRMTVVLESVYNDPEMLVGLPVKIQGMKDTNTQGIERQALVTYNAEKQRAEAYFDKLMPGSYRIVADGTVKKTVKIRAQDAAAGTVIGEKSFNVHFAGQTFGDTFADVNNDVSFTIDPEPMVFSGQLLVVDEEKNAVNENQYLHYPKKHDGIEIRASEYMGSHAPADFRLKTVSSDDKGQFAVALLPGLYGIRIKNLDQYWGEAVEIVDVKSGKRDYKGWPYYQIWPHSADIKNNFAYDVGGISFSSGTEFHGQLFVRKDVINVGLFITGENSQTMSQVIAIDTENESVIGTNYWDLVQGGGSAKIAGPVSKSETLTLKRGRPYCMFKNITPGSYSITVTHPRLTLANTLSFTYFDFNPPGYLPSANPPVYDAMNGVPSPLLPFTFDKFVKPKGSGSALFQVNRWRETDGAYYISRTNISPDYIRTSFTGSRVFAYEPDYKVPSEPYEVWVDLTEYVDDGKPYWYLFSSGGGELKDTIYVGGPQATAQSTELAVAYDLAAEGRNIDKDDSQPITGAVIRFRDGASVSTGSSLSGRIKDLDIQNVSHSNWNYSGSSFFELVNDSGVRPLVKLVVYMNRGVAIRGTVKNKNTLEPIPEAHVNVTQSMGDSPIMGSPTDSGGKFSYDYATGHQVHFIDVEAKGYKPFRKRLDPDTAPPDPNDPRTLAFDLSVNLEPLSGPQITEPGLNRYGGFLPSVMRSGNQSAFDGFKADEELTMSWSLKAKQTPHSVAVPQYDSATGTQPDTTLTLPDSIREVWLIDLRTFEKNTYDDKADILVLPNAASPHTVYAFLDDIVKGEIPNVFYQRILKFTPESADTVKAEGSVKLWQLPPDAFRPAFIVISSLGAVAIHEIKYTGELAGKELVGVRMPPWMGFLANTLGTVAGTQADAEKLKSFLPDGRFIPLPSFTGEITMEEGFLFYNYGIDVNLKEGMEGNGEGLSAMTPGMVGINVSAGLKVGMDGQKREFSLSLKGRVEKEKVSRESMKPGLFRIPTIKDKVKLDLDPAPTGSVESTASQQFDPENHPHEFSITHEVCGMVGAEIAVNINPILSKVPHVGPVVMILERYAELEINAKVNGLIGLRSVTQWKTTYPSLTEHYGTSIHGSRQLRRHFLGGDESTKSGDPVSTFDLCFNFGVGLEIKSKERAGAEGIISISGNECAKTECFKGRPALLVESNPVGTWPPLKRITGDVRATIKAFIRVWVIEGKKEWVWELLKINHEFTTDPFFQLVRMDIVVHETHRSDMQPVTYAGTSPQVIRGFMPIGSFDTAAGTSDAVLFTDMMTAGGNMALRVSFKNGDMSWGNPVLITQTAGAMIDSEIAALPGGGYLAVWTEIAQNDADDFFPPSKIMYSKSDAAGQNWSAPVALANLPDVADYLRLIRMGASVGLVFMETDEGPYAKNFKVKGAVYNGTAWGSVQELVGNTDISGFSIAGTPDTAKLPAHLVYVNPDNMLYAVTWKGATASAPLKIAENSGNDVSAAFGADNRHYLAWAKADRGIGLMVYDSATGWSDKGTAFAEAQPSDIKLAVLEDSTQPVLLMTWTEGGNPTALWYGFTDLNGTAQGSPVNLTDNSNGIYSLPDIRPRANRQATLFAMFRDDPVKEIRTFDIQYPGISVNNDRDHDSMNDVRELLIVDDDPEDAIETIDNVGTTDDFDKDGYSNLAEIEKGCDPSSADDFPPLTGDINGDGTVDLQDVILALMISAASDPDSVISVLSDVSGDGKIGVAEAGYILQKIAEKF